jgi:hydrogenase large subunit
MSDPDSYLFPAGAILDRDLSQVHEIDVRDKAQIQEYVAHSWYDYSGGKELGLHPYDGETNLNYSGPEPPFEHLDVEQSYSWMKSPRWRDRAMEVGPLARVLLMYARGHEPTRELAHAVLKHLDVPIEALFSTLGRTAARTLETKLLADTMQSWFDDLVANIKGGDTRTFNETLWEPSSWPKQCQGAGFMEAPRGALGHWIVIENQKIANYQAIVPSTWNAGPRDANGQAGAYEAALQDDHVLADSSKPLELLRTIHSFDPCIACAVHITDPDGEEIMQVKVV